MLTINPLMMITTLCNNCDWWIFHRNLLFYIMFNGWSNAILQNVFINISNNDKWCMNLFAIRYSSFILSLGLRVSLIKSWHHEYVTFIVERYCFFITHGNSIITYALRLTFLDSKKNFVISLKLQLFHSFESVCKVIWSFFHLVILNATHEKSISVAIVSNSYN